MKEPRAVIVVGVLGQWASGKTEAARTLISYLGSEGKVMFLFAADGGDLASDHERRLVE